MDRDRPSLYLIPTPLGNLDDITIRALKVLETVDIILCEDTRETKKLLDKYNIKNKLVSCHEFNEEKMKDRVLSYLVGGFNVGLVTDQGTPLISDPGYRITSYIVSKGYEIISLPGPTAFVPALTMSTLSPLPFLFYGFLNAKETRRKKELTNLKNYPFTIIFYEAPHRILATLLNIKEIFGDRKICLAREISKKYEEAIRGSINEILDSKFELKGEFVIVVEGAKLEFNFNSMSIVDHVNFYIEDGNTKNEAIKLVAKERGIPKSIVYKEYLDNNR
ncbi:MAG TPA: 16S rRNA (cytidine(1402)-2'-O)-methyltransferase [Candidatus Onthousia faecavium]|nr:16S rRNA (cytidine(1402)-2'-O)-methyltransferase [Candidatus Onthousia faecavium]